MRRTIEVIVMDELGNRIPTKQAFRLRVANQPNTLRFYPTSVIDPIPLETKYWTIGDIASDERYLIAGPDPIRQREWFATLQWDGGNLRVD